MEYIGIILGIFAGAGFVLQRVINGLLSKKVGIFTSNLVNHAVGAVFSCIVFVAALLFSSMGSITVTELPWYVWTAGFIGVAVIVISNYVTPKMSVVISTVLILIGMFISSFLLDYLFLNKGIKPAGLIGAILILCGCVLYTAGTRKVIVSET